MTLIDRFTVPASLVDALAGRAGGHDRDGSFAHEAFPLLHAAGLMQLSIPHAAGGAGLGLAVACRVVEDVARGDAAVALVLSQHLLHHAMLADPANRWPADRRAAVQRSSVDGVALINALRVEPDLGTPARRGLPATIATPTATGWSLRGRKTYATGIPGLRWLAVWARTDEPEPRVGTFLVDATTPGWRVEETWDHLGMRATRSDDVGFDDVPLPAAAAVDVRPPADWAAPDPVLGAWNSLLIAALYNGVARAARDWLLGYLHERTPSNLGAPLASLPRFQEAVGEIEVLLHTNERLVHGGADAVDAAGATDASAAGAAPLAKRAATANAIAAVEIAVRLVGNPGLSRRHPLERHYRDVLCGRIHTPQDDTIALGAGRAALTAAADARADASSPA